jgi:hypothetical protein
MFISRSAKKLRTEIKTNACTYSLTIPTFGSKVIGLFRCNTAGKRLSGRKTGYKTENPLWRLNLNALTKLIQSDFSGSKVAQIHLVGSISPPTGEVWESFRKVLLLEVQLTSLARCPSGNLFS